MKYKKLIKCSCGKNYRSKKARNKNIYICSGYHNYGNEFCQRNVILEMRYERNLNEEEVQLKVDRIEVNNGDFYIYYVDGHIQSSTKHTLKF